MGKLMAEVLPPRLREENYDYPPELFADREQIMRFDGGDDILIAATPVAKEERVLLMAKFALARELDLPSKPSTIIRIVRGERKNTTFMRELRKTLSSDRSEDSRQTSKGDIELTADRLGVYEIIWPFDASKMQQAIDIERALQKGLVPTY